MTVFVVPVTGARARDLVAILHDAEEDDDRIRAAIDDPSCTTYAALVDDRSVAAAVVRWAEPSEIAYVAVAAGERDRATAGGSWPPSGFRMDAVKPDAFAYIQPSMSEGGIPMRDMIVFAYRLDDRP